MYHPVNAAEHHAHLIKTQTSRGRDPGRVASVYASLTIVTSPLEKSNHAANINNILLTDITSSFLNLCPAWRQ